MATRTAMRSPGFASFGTCIRASAMTIEDSLLGCVEARRLGDDDFGRRSPERAVGHGGNNENRLCAVQPDAGGNFGAATAWIQMKHRDHWTRILLRQHVNRAHMIALRHLARDADLERKGV